MLPVRMHHAPKHQTDFDKMSAQALCENNRSHFILICLVTVTRSALHYV